MTIFLSYNETFSPSALAKSMEAYAFSPQKRQPPIQCQDTSSWLQKASRCPVIDYGESAPMLAKKSHLTEEELAAYEQPAGIIDLNRDGIELAVERRVMLFLEQAILCHNMPAFRFSSNGAEDQIGTASPIVWIAKTKKRHTHKREAAHSSTIPTLIATDVHDAQKKLVYLKGSSSYDQHNATIGMHIAVNGADELLDGKSSDEEHLRKKACALLNLVAANESDPVLATRLFVRSLSEEAEAIQEKLAADDPRKHVLKEYVKLGKKISAALATDAFFDRFLSVTIRPRDPDAKLLRPIIYARRYDIIRLQEVLESRIGKRMDLVRQGMKARDRSFLESMILEECADTPQRIAIEKMLGKTAAVFKSFNIKADEAERSLKAFRTRVHNLRTAYREQLDKLKKEIRADLFELKHAEKLYRSALFKDLRTKVRKWSPAEFSDRYLTATDVKVSAQWIAHVEALSKRTTSSDDSEPRIILNDAQAERCAKAFGVDDRLFFPQTITS